MIGHGLKVSQAEWDRRFMRLSREASTWSKDPDEQVGAVLVSPDRRSFSFGYNGLPHSMRDEPEVLCCKDLKNALTVHAEQNAIYNAPGGVAGWSIYVTKAPCLGCALGIIQSRVVRVVSAPIRSDSRWADEQRRAVQVLEANGVAVTFLAMENLDVQP